MFCGPYVRAVVLSSGRQCSSSHTQGPSPSLPERLETNRRVLVFRCDPVIDLLSIWPPAGSIMTTGHIVVTELSFIIGH